MLISRLELSIQGGKILPDRFCNSNILVLFALFPIGFLWFVDTYLYPPLHCHILALSLGLVHIPPE